MRGRSGRRRARKGRASAGFLKHSFLRPKGRKRTAGASDQVICALRAGYGGALAESNRYRATTTFPSMMPSAAWIR